MRLKVFLSDIPNNARRTMPVEDDLTELIAHLVHNGKTISPTLIGIGHGFAIGPTALAHVKYYRESMTAGDISLLQEYVKAQNTSDVFIAHELLAFIKKLN
jgi:hypothetical protein